MIRFLSVLLICMLPTWAALSQDVKDPAAPSDPAVGDVEVPVLAAPDVSNRMAGDLLYLRKATVKFSGDRSWKGVIYLTNNIIFSITNRFFDHLSIDTLSVYNIRKLKVVRWQPEALTNGLYVFRPSEYRVFTDASDTNGLPYTAPLGLFNQFTFSDGEQKRTLYTVFYDRWVEGKTGSFRWENTRATTFGYDFENPVDGVVTEIEFDSRY